MVSDKVYNEIRMIAEVIATKYFQTSLPEMEKFRLSFYLEADIESSIIENGEEAEKYIMELINGNPCEKEIRELINMDKIMRSVEVRRDFGKALKSVKNGSKLSPIIGYGLSDRDIKELAKLHKANKFRKKIEDLLEDCNFHAEFADFIDHKYDRYLI